METLCNACLLIFVPLLHDKMALWLVQWKPDRAVWVQPWPETMCCVLGQDTLLSQSLSPPSCIYKWLPANCMLGVTLRWTSIPSKGWVEILLVASCFRNRDKLLPDEPLGSYADFTIAKSDWACFY